MTIATTASILDRVAATFNFTVEKFPLSGPDNMATPFYGLFRSDRSTVVHAQSVSKSYVPHQTSDVLALVSASQSAFGDAANVWCYFDQGHHVTVQPSDAQRVELCQNDNIFPRVFIRAGYDGRSFLASVGFYRDLCANLSMMKQISGTTVTIRHNSNLPDKMEDLIAQFNTLRDGWSSLADIAVRLEAQPVALASFLDSVYGAPPEEEGRGRTIHKNRTEAIFTRLAAERIRSRRPELGSAATQVNGELTVSAWEAFNAVQGYSQHVTTRRGNPSDHARVIAASSDRYVLAAEKQALLALSA